MLKFDSFASRKAEIAINLGRAHKMLAENSLKGVILSNHYNFSWIITGGSAIL